MDESKTGRVQYQYWGCWHVTTVIVPMLLMMGCHS